MPWWAIPWRHRFAGYIAAILVLFAMFTGQCGSALVARG